MPLQTSGQISLNDLQGEFGGTHPASMSEYRGKDCTDLTGPISFSDFYGKDDFVAADSDSFFMVIRSNTNPTTNTVTQSHTFTVPCGVFIVHIVCVGGGASGGEAFYSGGGGGGGSLTYVNNVDVTPGMQLEVKVGNGGATGGTRSNGNNGYSSYVKKNGTTIALANGGSAGKGGTGNTTNFMGGAGGTAWNGSSAMSFAGTNATYASYAGGTGGRAEDDNAGGGGGAAGYAGRGGHGKSDDSVWNSIYNSPNPPTGSGGGSGSWTYNVNYLTNSPNSTAIGDRAGGVGLSGIGSDGNDYSKGGSGGADGLNFSGNSTSPRAGEYGGGGSGAGLDQPGQTISPEGLQPSNCGGQSGAPGAVRIIWGTNKSFPNNAS